MDSSEAIKAKRRGFPLKYLDLLTGQKRQHLCYTVVTATHIYRPFG